MSVRTIKAGSTDQSVIIRIIDSTDGTPETGVVFNTAGIDLWYRRDGAASTDITEATLSALTDAHSDGGFLHINDGWYRLDLPDAAVADGVAGVQIGGTVTGMVVLAPYIELVDYNPYDGVRLGLTALPNAAADAAGGLVISDAGGFDVDLRHPAAAAIINMNTVFNTDFATNYNTTLDQWNTNVESWNATAVPAEHTGGYPIVTIKDGTGTGEINTNAGAIALVDLVTTTTTATTVTNQLTAAQIATGVWQDATAGDFTVASSIGKALYIANIVPGAAGGHFIAGSNAATTFATLTVTGATVYTGNVSMAAGLTITQSTSNGHGIVVTGNGTGAGIRSVGGATGPGVALVGGGTSGDGMIVTTTSGHGFSITATGASKHGVVITGGNSGTSDGLKLVAGTGGVGFRYDTLTASGATTLTGLSTGAFSCTTLTASGAVALQSTLTVTGATSLAALSTSGTTTFNALTVTNATTLTGAVSLGSTLGITGAITATNASNNLRLGTFTVDINAIAWNTAWATPIENAVWDAVLASHLDAGSTGEALGAAGSAGDPWATALPGAYGAGTAGKIIGDNINATVSSRATQASVDDLPTNAELATSQAAADDATLAAIAALNNPSAAAIAIAVWDADATAHQTQGTFGQAIGDPGADTDSIWALANTNLNATVGSRASQASVDDVPTNAELATALAAADDAVLAAIAALNNLSAAGAATAVTTALTTALTEGYRGTNATGSVRDLLYEIIAHLGEAAISGTTKTLKKLDGATTAKTYTLNDATTPSSITETT